MAFSIAAVLVVTSSAIGQVVINEIMKEERTAGGGTLDDTREFVELYNAGNSPVDLANYSLVTYDVTANSALTAYPFTGAASTIIPAHGFYVVAIAVCPTLTLRRLARRSKCGRTWSLGRSSFATLPDPFSGNIVDAVAYDMYRNGSTGTTVLPADLQAQVGHASKAHPFHRMRAARRHGLAGHATETAWIRIRTGSILVHCQ